MSLAESLENAAAALPEDADRIRPANGDPIEILELLDDDALERLLVWMLTNEPSAAAELADEWVEMEGSEKIFERVDEETLPKPGRKVLRRVCHQLRSRGIELAKRPRVQPVVSRLPEIEETIEQAYVTPIDPRGSHLVFLIESHPAGGLRLFEIVLDEVRGIADAEVYSAGRSKVRNFVKEILRAREGSLAPAEVAPASARALVARIARRHPSDRPLPRAFSESRAHLIDDEAPTPGELAAEALGKGGDIRRAAELVREGSLGPWPPARERLLAAAERLRADAQGQIVLSESAERDRVATALDAVAQDFFADGFAQWTAERFEESAYPLWKGGREDDARACLAAAEALRGEAPAEGEVARALLERCLGPVLDAIRAEMGDGAPTADAVEPGGAGDS